jgi:hypothetical protein
MPAEELTPTLLVVNQENMTVDLPKFTCLIHQQGIRVDVPDFVEINSRTTLDCMSKMSQRAWEHISTGELFRHLFYQLFTEEIPIPQTIDELNKGDFGVIHGAGMIVQGCEALFMKKNKIFFRNPENHLHPKSERNLVSMLKEMQRLLDAEGEWEVGLNEEPKV